MKPFPGWIWWALILLSGCALPEEGGPWGPEDFPNVLASPGLPKDPQDLTAYAFADQGSWFMFGLPSATSPEAPGSFPGPLLLTEGGVWLSPSLFGPEVSLQEEAIQVEWDPEAGPAAVYLPGRLRQDLVAGSLHIRLELVFASSRVSLVRAEVENRGGEDARVRWGWKGGPFFLDAELSPGEGGGVMASLDSGARVVLLPVGGSETEAIEISHGEGSGYAIREASFTLSPGETVTRYLRISMLGPEDGPGGGEGQEEVDGAERVFQDNGARWATYLRGALGEGGGRREAPGVRNELAVKAVETLISNWREPRGGLGHAGLFPSYAYRGFHGVWSWDSWKHARALALFAPDLAKDQMRVLLDHQNDAGMIPDVIYADSTENNWRDTKPPLAAWAVDGIFQATGDTAFVEEVLPALLRYHDWWYRDRDHDGNGLCEYGSTDGTRIAAAWESGMDNAVRFDEAVMVQNGPDAWSLDQESVDLNAYLYAEKLYLAGLLDALGRVDEGRAIRADAERLGRMVRETFFDEASGYFFDVRLDSKEPIRVHGPEGWIPLWAGVANAEQAEHVARVMMDPARFLGVVPLPTLTMDHPEFDPTNGYWRGPVWLDQAYFGVRGLQDYGFHDEAMELTARLVDGAQGLVGEGPIHENYHPLTGEGLNAAHFSWSAAHLLMLANEGFMNWDRDPGRR